jgi:S-adenosylmethionine:tRNA ribosyltransferase-isomerase
LNAPYKHITISEFDYRLDDSRIAKHPLAKRDLSKLLIYKNKNIFSSTFTSIVDEIAADDLMVFNNTKVVQARLRFTKQTGANIEIFLLNPVNPSDYQTSFTQTYSTQWNCIVGNIKRWKGEVLKLIIPRLDITLTSEMLGRTDDGALVEFKWDDKNITFAQVVEYAGEVPIPPYLNRNPEENDKMRYQTVYAKPEGSVAAPTAGLHFTENVLVQLKQKGVLLTETTLHVGAGTFRPVKSTTIGDHEMHTERIYVTIDLLDNILSRKGDVVAVGTTSLRTLESIYWLGVKALDGILAHDNFKVGQWDGYTLNQNYTLAQALNALKEHIIHEGKGYLSASTQMIVVPGYKFRVVNRLITNFHQPRSTLLLLVAAFIGDDWKKVYTFALENGFRFLSYGDSSILSPSFK